MMNDRKLELIQGDITSAPVDVIVNAANRDLIHGGGVAGAILRKGGPVIQEESDRWIHTKGKVDPDHPAWTHAGNLPCKYIIHAAGPVWGEGQEDEKLIRTIQGTLRMAGQLKAKSMSMPPISTGIFRFPKARAAPLFIRTIDQYWLIEPHSTLEIVRIIIIDQDTFKVFSNAFKEYWENHEITRA